MSIYHIISSWAEKIFTTSSNIYITPKIPEKKLDGAIKGMGDVDPGSVIMIYDSTFLGSARSGIIFTNTTLYYNSHGKWNLPYKEINHAEIKTIPIKKKSEVVSIYLKDGTECILKEDYIKNNTFVEFINDLVNEVTVTTEVESVKPVPLEEQPEDVKLIYLKIIINFLNNDDGRIDGQEMSQVYSLITRIKLSRKYRAAILNYAAGEPTTSLIENMLSQVNEVTREILIPSLVKDLINILFKLGKHSYQDDPFIMNLVIQFNVSKKTLELILKAIKEDEKIFNDETNDKGLADGFSSLASGAASVGLPIAALYFSGTVTGLSATGITSGLAALGFGGILGFSGMVTGVGVLLIAGYGTHQGIKRLTGSNEIEARKRKEIMLQQVAKHHQNTINLLLEDIHDVIVKLGDALQKLSALEYTVQQQNEKLRDIFAKLKFFSRAASQTVEDRRRAEICAMRTRLPLKLDVNRLAAITADAPHKQYYDIVLNCYEKKLKESTVEYLLRKDLTYEQTETLKNLLVDTLGYFSIVSTFKGTTSTFQGFFK